MFPLKDDIPSTRLPLMTIVLIVINIYIFQYEISLGQNGMEKLFYTFGLVPAHYSSYQSPPAGYFPFFSSVFLHGSWIHVLGNMWMLWLFGDNVEDRMGRVEFLLFYIICGLIAGLAHYFMNPTSAIPVVGASGAVAGIMGAYFLMYRHARVLTFVPPFFLFYFPAWIYLSIWILTQFWGGAANFFVSNNCSPIAFWAHVGGFLAGMVLYRFFLKRKEEIRYWD